MAHRRYLHLLLPTRHASSIVTIELRHQCFWRDQPPRALNQVRQRAGLNSGKAYEYPGMISIVIRYEENIRIGLHQNLTIQQIGAQNETFPALMHPRQQLSADFKRRSPV